MLLNTSFDHFPITETFGRLTLNADQEYGLLKMNWHYENPLVAVLPDVLSNTFFLPIKTKDVIQLNSRCPSMKLIIRLHHDIKIPARGQMTCFIKIPLDVSLTINDQEIMALSSEVLSKTWFGDMEGGQVCYVLKNHMLHTSKAEISQHYALCPVTIINTDGNELTFSKFLITPQHLSLYKNGSQVWTDCLDITFKGEQAPSKVKIKNIPNNLRSDSFELLLKPQKLLPSLLQHTFERVKTMSQI